jgi:hypothetical protein
VTPYFLREAVTWLMAGVVLLLLIVLGIVMLGVLA